MIAAAMVFGLPALASKPTQPESLISRIGDPQSEAEMALARIVSLPAEIGPSDLRQLHYDGPWTVFVAPRGGEVCLIVAEINPALRFEQPVGEQAVTLIACQDTDFFVRHGLGARVSGSDYQPAEFYLVPDRAVEKRADVSSKLTRPVPSLIVVSDPVEWEKRPRHEGEKTSNEGFELRILPAVEEHEVKAPGVHE